MSWRSLPLSVSQTRTLASPRATSSSPSLAKATEGKPLNQLRLSFIGWYSCNILFVLAFTRYIFAEEPHARKMSSFNGLIIALQQLLTSVPDSSKQTFRCLLPLLISRYSKQRPSEPRLHVTIVFESLVKFTYSIPPWNSSLESDWTRDPPAGVRHCWFGIKAGTDGFCAASKTFFK